MYNSTLRRTTREEEKSPSGKVGRLLYYYFTILLLLLGFLVNLFFFFYIKYIGRWLLQLWTFSFLCVAGRREENLVNEMCCLWITLNNDCAPNKHTYTHRSSDCLSIQPTNDSKSSAARRKKIGRLLVSVRNVQKSSRISLTLERRAVPSSWILETTRALLSFTFSFAFVCVCDVLCISIFINTNYASNSNPERLRFDRARRDLVISLQMRRNNNSNDFIHW